MGERTTLILDEEIMARVRQMSEGNISKFVNQCLKEHLIEEPKKKSMFGVLRGKISARNIEKLRKEDERAHENLHR